MFVGGAAVFTCRPGFGSTETWTLAEGVSLSDELLVTMGVTAGVRVAPHPDSIIPRPATEARRAPRQSNHENVGIGGLPEKHDCGLSTCGPPHDHGTSISSFTAVPISGSTFGFVSSLISFSSFNVRLD